MKSIKMISLAALAALMMTMMVVALVGASPAMAEETTLCNADESPCEASNVVKHIHEETLTGNLAQLLNSLGNVKCDVLFLSTSVGGSGSPQNITGHFTYTNCKRKKLVGEENCTVEEKPGTTALLQVLKTGHETAEVTGEGEVRVVCGSFIDCTYNGEGLQATAKGPLLNTETNGETVIESQEPQKVSGPLCPDTAELDILTTPLEPTYISSEVVDNTEETTLCKADESPCEAGPVTHVHEETLTGNLAQLLNSLGNVKCDVLFLSTSVGGSGSPQDITGHFTYTNCKRKKLIGEENCTVEEKTGTSSLIEILRTGHETAEVTGEGEVRVVCGSFIDCTYNGEGLKATAKGPLLSEEANGETVSESQVTHKVSGSLCPETAELDLLITPLEPTYISLGPTEETVLCKADENPCAEGKGNLVTHVHEATLTGSPALLLNNIGNVKCDVLFLSTSVGALGAPQVILGNFTYSSCFRKKLKGEESCTVTEKNGPTEVKVLREGHETAKVTGKGEVEVLCGSFIQCVFDDEGLNATAKGPLLSTETNGEVSLSEQETHKVSGTLCPSEAELDITTTPLEPTYISE